MHNNLNILNSVRIVLCNTSHNGNIGSTARAMKTMGIYNLTLVSPQVLPDDHSIALASNAKDVVENATILSNLNEAISDTTLAVALTARRREYNQDLMNPRQIMPEVLDTLQKGEKVAFVFGTEKSGLTIEQLELCNRMVTIPGNPQYFSLNLAQAVQIICYEVYSNLDSNLSHLMNEVKQATIADNIGILNHLDKILLKLNYYKNKNHEITLRRLRNVIHRARLEREDVDLIRGILKRLESNI
ncbi:MAG: RNA methyltransferase [Neisseriaceae bacterium]